MKSASLMMVLAASLVAAQNGQDKPPACAQECLKNIMTDPNSGCKGDAACICKDESFLNDMACCLVGVCKKEELEMTVQFSKKICGAVGVPIPDKVECKKGASASSSSTHSSSATGTAAGAASSSTAAAAPMLVGTGSLAVALIAFAAAL